MKTLYFVAMFVLLSAQLHGAVADGALPNAATGEHGANRRVLTNSAAFTGVKGVFSGSTLLPSPHILPNSIYKPGPTFYLGSSQKNQGANNLQVDAGFQWEPKARPVYAGSTFIRNAPPGWSVFVRATSPLGEDSISANGWRCGLGTENSSVSSVELSWVFFRRSTSPYAPTVGPKFGGYLSVNAVGALAQPSSELGSNKFVAKVNTNTPEGLTGDLSAMSGKRVVGITQNSLGSLPLPLGTVYDEDGTTLTGLIFSQGQVTQANPLAGPFGSGYSPSGWTIWDDTNTDLNSGNVPGGTGYYPGGKDLTLRVVKLTPPFNETILNQPAPGARDVFILKFNNAPLPGRYSNEDTDISLRRFVPTGGTFVNPGG